MRYDYQTKGTCSTKISFDIEGNVVKNVQFTGGCNGNLQGSSKLGSGMKIDDAIEKLSGIRCGRRPTSCPDQLARALQQLKKTSQQGG